MDGSPVPRKRQRCPEGKGKETAETSVNLTPVPGQQQSETATTGSTNSDTLGEKGATNAASETPKVTREKTRRTRRSVSPEPEEGQSHERIPEPAAKRVKTGATMASQEPATAPAPAPAPARSLTETSTAAGSASLHLSDLDISKSRKPRYDIDSDRSRFRNPPRSLPAHPYREVPYPPRQTHYGQGCSCEC